MQLSLPANHRKYIMGMYTEFHFNCMLKKNVPREVIDILNYMIDWGVNKSLTIPSHTFFECYEWDTMLNDSMQSFLTNGDNSLDGRCLCIRTSVKNYNSVIEKFIDWIWPYLSLYDGKFLGYYRYEQNEEPTLIFADDTSRYSRPSFE